MRLPSITFDRQKLSHFTDMIETEWLVTNGLGGYASSTVLGINTRKYHGLLTAAFHPPRDRRVCLAKLDESIIIGKDAFSLGANEFQEGIYPKGYEFLMQFSVSPFPKYVYSIQNLDVEKTVLMPYGKNAVITLYGVLNKNRVKAKVRIVPLTSWRHIHSVIKRSEIVADPKQQNKEDQVLIVTDVPHSAVLITSNSGRYCADPTWVERIYFREEARRHESYVDDCYHPGYFEIPIEPCERADFTVTAVADENEEAAREVATGLPSTVFDINALYTKEILRCENALKSFGKTHKNLHANDWLDWLLLAADAFLVGSKIEKQKALIAGYHWFETWGRDTFVSLPGLTLVTGRFDDARKLFLSFKQHCKNGLIPNFLPDQMEHVAYNTVDASLWYVNAVLQYLKYTGDFEFVRQMLWETLKQIFENYLNGTAFNIRADTDGLLLHGPQLTWMDAAVDGKPVTPRAGKAVEIQALWYNTTRTVEMLSNKFGEKNVEEASARMAEKARNSFAQKFWNRGRNCLYDAVGERGPDQSLRPNQILAVSLDFVMLDKTRNEAIVDILRRELLTPYGLRTLEKDDSEYVGVYAGDRQNRDRAYHNGTVWPWLLGPFTTGFLKTKGYSDFRREYAFENLLAPLFTKQVFYAGLGWLSEIFDGDFPHKPRGCIAQAWSLAEPFRAYVEDSVQIRPPYESQVLRLD